VVNSTEIRGENENEISCSIVVSLETLEALLVFSAFSQTLVLKLVSDSAVLAMPRSASVSSLTSRVVTVSVSVSDSLSGFIPAFTAMLVSSLTSLCP
jgi:hypothetical protein